MKAINFVTEISKIKPNKSEIKKNTDFSDEFIDAYINDLQIVKKSTNVSISADNAIIDLIFNYDLTNLRILTVSFNKDTDTLEDDKYIYVGWAEAFPFAILKETGEIVELDWEDPTYIISYMAKDQSSFLDILIEIEKLNQKDIFGSITEKEKKENLKQISIIAGGDKYSWFLSNFDNEEIWKYQQNKAINRLKIQLGLSEDNSLISLKHFPSTRFKHYGIQRLVRVTDKEGNVTTSTYDMGDRRTEVNHPASGITTFTYDALGNVLNKQTANLAKEGKSITYDYDYHRLTGINYPDHPENNVKYYYGGRNASQNRIGRLMLREDGTGAIEYFYGKMGEVTKTRRTLIVPNQAIATYVTQWTYDSHNRLLEMIYPDEEKVTYSYNLGGQLEKVRGYKSYGYDYVNRIGYDKFEQRTYLKYCNGAETFYTYKPARRRLQNLTVNAGGKSIMDNGYTYDAVSNVLSIANKAALPESGKAGGQMAHAYTYDALYRLASATGTYAGADSKTASYRLEMSYDNMHRIVSKKQHLTQQGVQFDGTLHVGYDLAYTYGKTEGRKFQLAEVKDANYRTEENPDSVAKVDNNHTYTYDANGNLVHVNTGRIKQDGALDSTAAERKLRWDEENRLTASDDTLNATDEW